MTEESRDAFRDNRPNHLALRARSTFKIKVWRRISRVRNRGMMLSHSCTLKAGISFRTFQILFSKHWSSLHGSRCSHTSLHCSSETRQWGIALVALFVLVTIGLVYWGFLVICRARQMKVDDQKSDMKNGRRGPERQIGSFGRPWWMKGLKRRREMWEESPEKSNNQ